MFDRTITLFNHLDGQWLVSVIPDVSLVEKKSSELKPGETNNGDTVKMLIQSDKEQQIRTTDGLKRYAQPKMFKGSDEITFDLAKDFFYVGDWNDVKTVSDSDYENGLYNAMNDAYDGVYLISSCVFYSLLPHFEIGGR